MDEKMQQIIEDSEKVRDRNRDLESELHGLKVENERLKEENETMFATQGGADQQNLRDALEWLHDQGGIGAVYSRYKGVVLGEVEETLEVVYSEDIEKRLMPDGVEWPRFEDGELVCVGDEAVLFGRPQKVEFIEFFDTGVFLQSDDNDQQFSYGERIKRPESKCRDCAHWTKDPTADNMGVCWFFYHEYDGEDCYAARLGGCGACEEFMPCGERSVTRDGRDAEAVPAVRGAAALEIRETDGTGRHQKLELAEVVPGMRSAAQDRFLRAVSLRRGCGDRS